MSILPDVVCPLVATIVGIAVALYHTYDANRPEERDDRSRFHRLRDQERL